MGILEKLARLEENIKILKEIEKEALIGYLKRVDDFKKFIEAVRDL